MNDPLFDKDPKKDVLAIARLLKYREIIACEGWLRGMSWKDALKKAEIKNNNFLKNRNILEYLRARQRMIIKHFTKINDEYIIEKLTKIIEDPNAANRDIIKALEVLYNIKSGSKLEKLIEKNETVKTIEAEIQTKDNNINFNFVIDTPPQNEIIIPQETPKANE